MGQGDRRVLRVERRPHRAELRVVLRLFVANVEVLLVHKLHRRDALDLDLLGADQAFFLGVVGAGEVGALVFDHQQAAIIQQRDDRPAIIDGGPTTVPL